MKQSIYKSLFFFALLFGALTSCYNPLSEDVSISSVRRGREFTVVPSMIPMVDGMATKSQYTGNDDQVYDWNLFIFEGTSDAAVLCGKYYNSGSSSDMSISFTVKLDADYTYFAIANVGKQIDNLASYTTLGALRSARVAISGPRQGLPAATSFTHKFTRSDYEAAQAAHTNLTFPSSVNKLTRLVGRYDIVVQKNDLQIWDLDITSLRLYGAGSVTPWVTGSYTTQDVVLNDADNGGATNQDLYKLNRGEKVSFYPVENMISTPSALSSNTDMWAKVPGNVGNAHPSYIEMTGTATVNDGSGLSKPVTYRFYLGTDNVKNFEVQRNVTHTLTFVPNDETITNGHNGNWKITPGSFTDTRSLMFASNSTTPTSSTNPIRVRAGESLDEAIVRTVGGSPSNFKYNVSFGGQLASDGNMLVRSETSSDVAQLSGTTLSSLHLTAKANIDAEGFVKINTIDQPNESPKQDKLYIQIYNAWLEITNDPLVLTYEWNANQSGSGQNAGFRSSVTWTASASSGWSVTPTSGGASLTGTSVSIYPNDVNSSTTANKTGQVTLTPDGGVAKTVTMIQKFKPVVTTQPTGLTWTASEGSSDYKELVITSNETWTLTVSPGWTVKDTNGNPVTSGGTSNNGASTSVTVRVYPDGPNVSIPPTDKTGSIVITPSRGTDAEKATVTLTHQKAAVSLALTESGHDWTWKQKDVDSDNFTFHVTGNLNWSASVSDPDNWRIVSGASGSGNGNVVVRPKAVNSSTSDIKGATLTIQCTDSGVTVDSPSATLRQLVHPNIGLASSGNLQWAWDNTTAQTITLTLSPAGYGWQAALVNGDASHWVMTEDHTNNTISIRPATVNDDVNNAPSIQVRITATDPDDTQSSAVVTCTHNARAAYFNFVDPSQQNLSWRWYEGASNTVVVNFSTSETWNYSVSSGSSYFSATKNGNSLTIAPVGANTGGARNGTITIEVVGHSELNKTITLAQEAKPTVSVAPTGYDWAWTSTSADAQSFTVTCTSGYTWSASKTDANNKFSLSGTTGASGAAFTAGPVGTNEDTENAYSATVTVTLVNSGDPHAGDITVSVPLSQAKKVLAPYLTPSASSLEWFWYESSTKTVNIDSNKEWTYTKGGGDAEHFTVTREGSTLSVTVTPNADNTRGLSATISITCVSNPELNTSVTLSQTKRPALSVSPTNLNWAWDAIDGKSVTVTADSGFSWEVVNSNTSHYGTSTSGSTITVTPSGQNTDEVNAIAGTLTIRGVGDHNSDITATVTMNHEKKTSNFITATPGSLTFDDLANSDAYKQLITVSSNGAWSFDLPSGYNASTTSGSGNGSFYIWPTSKNNTYEDKSVTMTINGPGGVSANVTLIHEAIQRTLDHYEFSVSPSSFSLEWPGTTHSDYENIYPSITAVYISEHYDYSYEDEWVDGWTVDNISGNVGSHGEWSQPNTYSYRLTASNTNDTDWPSGTITLRYTGSSFPSLSGATASSSWEIQGKPTITLSPNSMTWDWDQSGNISGVRQNPNISSSSNDYFHPDNSDFVFTSNPGNIFDRGYYGIYPTSQNTDSSPRSGSGKISYVFHGVTIESNEITLTQTGKPAGPTYYDYTAAYVDTYFGPAGYSIHVGESTTVLAKVIVGHCHTTATSAPSNKSDYDWDGVDDFYVTSYGFTSENEGIATVSGNTVNGVSVGTSVISSDYTISSGDYDVVFASDDCTVHVESSDVITHELEVTIEDPEITVGASTQAHAYWVEYTNGIETSRSEVTNSSTWSANNPSGIVTVSNTSGTRGRVTGASPGSVQVKAVYLSDIEGVLVTVVAAAAFDHYEYGNPSVSAGASPNPIAYNGTSSQLSYSVSCDRWEYWTDGSYRNHTTISDASSYVNASYSKKSGNAAFSVNSSSGAISVSANTGNERSAVFTVSCSIKSAYTVRSGELDSGSDDVTVTQDPVPVATLDHYEYGNPSVSASASPNPIAASGTSSQLSYSVSCDRWEYWTDGSYRNHTTISDASSYVNASYSKKSGNSAFSVNSSSGAISVSANTGSSVSRTAVFTVTCSIKNAYTVRSGQSNSGSDEVSVVQSGKQLESLGFTIGGEDYSAELNAGNGYSLSYQLVGFYSDGSQSVIPASSYLVTYDTGQRGLLLSQGTCYILPDAYYELDEGSYDNIQTDCYVSYGGLTSNVVRLTSDITWQWLGYGFDKSASLSGGSINIYEFYRSTLSTNTIRKVAVSNFTYQKIITNSDIPVADILFTSSKSGNTLYFSHSSQYATYNFDALVTVTAPKGSYVFTIEGGMEHAVPYTVYHGDEYEANAH